MNVHAQIAAATDWRAENDHVLALGLAWLAARLDGDAGDAERDRYDAARETMAISGESAAIDRISAACGLSPFAEDILLIALAAEIDGGVAWRYADFVGQSGTMAASPHLIARLLFGGGRLPVDAWDALGADAPLRRFALVDWGPAALANSVPITLPARVRDLLGGIEQPATEFTPEPVVQLPARLALLAEALGGSDGAPLRLQLLGPKRSGRRALAVAVLAHGALGAIVREGPVGDAAALARECLLGQCGLVVIGDAEPALARDFPAPLIVISDKICREDMPLVRLPALTSAERREIWPDGDVVLACQFALAPQEIAALVRLPAAERWAAAREIGARDLADLATRIVPERGWDDMVLAPALRSELAALTAQLAQRALVHDEWGYSRLMGRASGTTALFAGASGVGKTMAAEAIAGELGLDLFTVDLSRIASKYIGETEKNLARLFDAAQAGGCVLFFDEADALFGKRSEVKDSHDRYANAEISYLLQRMERFSGLAILATNLKSHLDTAFLRRIRLIVDFPLPDHDARLELWRRALPPSAPQGRIDWAALARHELSPANIVTIGSNAAFRAAQHGGAIGMADLTAALAAEYRKLDRDPAGLGG